MKILILANNDIGLYKFRKELIQNLLNLGHSVVVALPEGKFVSDLRQMGCTFVHTPLERRGMNPLKDFKLFRQYRTLLKTLSPDMVITYTIKPNIYGGLAAGSMHIPCYINVTGLGTAFQKENFVKKLVVTLYKTACKNAKVVFFENEGNRQVFLDENIVSEKQTCLLNGAGVNIEEYHFVEYPIQQDIIKFLFIGRIMKEKGIDELINAFEKLQAEMKQYNRKVELDIVGPMEENDIYDMKSWEQKGNIRYYGFQGDVKPFIQECHCFVLPSYHEGMANTLLEAGAMGRPLITTDICGCKEAVRLDGENGFLVKVRDSEDLYKQMKKFVMLDAKIKEDMARKSSEYIAEKFSKEQVVTQTIQAIFSQ